MTPSVVTRSLSKRFGHKWALAHVDLEVGPGTGLLVVGDNGSGKSTLLRLLAGLLLPTLGTVEILGLSPQEPGSGARSKLSLVGHYGQLYEALTPLETLAFWSRLGGRKRPTAELEALLSEAGLAADRDTRVSGFSAGMRKRLSISRLQLERPRVALLDEPFSALDEDGRSWLAGTLSRLKEAGTTLVLASHDPRRAAPVCDRAIRIVRGQVAWQGSIRDLESSS